MPDQSAARREPLTLDEVVTHALAIIDEHGSSGLSMRKLGASLGVEGMALYHHVSGRADLLEAVVDRVLDGLMEDLHPRLVRTWQGYLQALAHAIRERALSHPKAFPLVATHHPAAPWLRPPLRDLSLVEHFLSTVTGHGFSTEQAVAAYQLYSSFLLGHLLLECAELGAATAPDDEPVDEGGADIPQDDGRIDIEEFPTVAALRPELSQHTTQAQFEDGLENLIDRLEMSISQ
ncbi:TetR/AcrR family transcriptional regulator C-terminal domain-containing protein [Serinicoccus sp. LYQ131]|uniref:TetR/AcrR family transcriptional regulator C-terminal domain-containing protein n=1 Tax=Serinicoccus sp. LYQ131 TaxID=3378797 RepID=UPI0038550D63